MATRRPTRRVERAVRDLVRSVVPPDASHLDLAVQALVVAEAAEALARAEIAAARDLDGASWADVGAALGVTRQAAHERFRG